MIHFLIACAWGLFVFFSLIGWGWPLNKLLLPKMRLDLGWLGALGLAFSTVVGGLLNLTDLISKTSVTIYLALGFIMFCAWLLENKTALLKAAGDFLKALRGKRTLALLFCVAVLFGGLRYALSVSPGSFNVGDDFQAYFVFPAKMLETGHLGNDPFSERRIVSMLGSGYFLDTFISARLPAKDLHLFDQGVMLLLLLAIVWGFAADFEVSQEHRLVLAIGVLLTDQPVANITSMFAGVVLFLALARLFYLGARENINIPAWARVIVLSLVTAGLISLKNNFVPAAFFLFVLYYYFRFKNTGHSRRTIAEFFLAGLLVMLLLSPWMAAMYQSSGTLFYPVFGKGFYFNIPGQINSANAEFFTLNGLARAAYGIRQVLFLALALPAYFYFKVRRENRPNFQGSVAMLITAVLGTAAIIYITGSIDVYRYIFPFLFAAFLVFVIMALSPKTGNPNFPDINLNYAAIGFIALSLVAGYGLGGLLDQEKVVLADLDFGVSNRQLLTPAQTQEYVNLQQAVPAGQIILARLDNNYLFDFKRNPVYIIDSPGGISLPPGMPFFQGPERLAQYFLSKNIRYVAYSYADGANFNQQTFGDSLGPNIHPYVRARVTEIFDFQANLESLGKTRKIIYDDGSSFVLDLSQMR